MDSFIAQQIKYASFRLQFLICVSVLTTIFYFLSWYFCKLNPTKAEIAGLENEGADQMAPDETAL